MGLGHREGGLSGASEAAGKKLTRTLPLTKAT